MNVVDSLFVTIGLDASGFKTGSKEIDDLLGKLSKQAVKSGKDVEESGTKIGQSISKVTAIVGSLFALMLAGRGFKEFITDVNDANAAMGRFSANLGLAPQNVSELTQLVEQLGGTSADTASALEGANKIIQDFLVNGKGIPEQLSRMMAQVGGHVDFEHGPLAYLESVAPILQRLNEIDPAKAHAFAEGLSIPDSVANTMVKYGAGLKEAMEARSNLTATNAQIKAAQDVTAAWANMEQHAMSLGNTIAGALDSSVVKFANDLATLADKTKVIFEWLQKTNEQSKDWWIIKFLNNVSGETAFENGVTAKPALSPDEVKRRIAAERKQLGVFGPASGAPSSADMPVAGGAEEEANISPEDLAAITGMAQPLKVSGSEISSDNPLPVKVVEAGSGGFWSWLTGGSGSGMTSAVSTLNNMFRGGAGDSQGSGGHVTSAEGSRRASHLVNMMMSEYGLTRDQAVGAAGVMGYESGDFRTMQEKGQAPGHGGWGYAQWTGPRRHAFMAWATANGLDPSSPEANEGFLKYEIAHSKQYQAAIARLKHTTGVPNAARAWEEGYEGMREGGPGIPTFAAHIARAEAYAKSLPTGAPSAALNNMGNQYSATTSSSSNSLHIGSISVNAPQAKDSYEIAQNLGPALAQYGAAPWSDTGPQ